MNEFISLTLPGGQINLGLHPVTVNDYRGFLRETGRPTPNALKQVLTGSVPVIDVPQVHAVSYCEWCGSRAGLRLRLPRMAELHVLMETLQTDDLDAGVWPHHHGRALELRGGLKPVFLCEWTSDTVEAPHYGDRPPRLLADIFYPPWLREGSNAGHVHASLSASEGYAFVTFRLAYDS